MEAQQYIENIYQYQDILEKRKFSVQSIFYLIAGVVFFFVYNNTTDPTQSSIQLLAMLLMATAFTIGIIKLINGKKEWVLRDSGLPLTEKSVFFNSSDSMRLQTLLSQKKFTEIEALKHVTDDNSGVRLLVLFSEKDNYAAILLSEYKPFAYNTISDVITFKDEDGLRFIQSVKNLVKA